MSTFCVVGGGLAGLEFALHSALKGHRIVIYEAGPQLRTNHVHFDTRVFDGDEKKVHWTADEHWALGGISERLGGRSLCYHGVMLPLEEKALNSWPEIWQKRLKGPAGLYHQLQQEFTAKYPEMSRNQAVNLPLHHAPQAAVVGESAAFTSYSPLYQLEPLIRDGVITIERATISQVEKKSDGFYLVDAQGQTVNTTGFERCILSASALVNNKIITQSLARSTIAQVTDHYCIGVAVKVREGERIADYRHEMLWHGFSEHHDLNANIFVVERNNFDNGDRLLLLMAVMEQNPALSDYSELHCRYHEGKTTLEIQSKHSDAVIENYNQLASRIVDFASTQLGVRLSPLHDTAVEQSEAFFGASEGIDFEQALNALNETERTNIYTRFVFPYGAYEHESCTHPIGGHGDIALTDSLELTAMPGVYAIGPGAFPRLGIANPALTICSLSRWLASHL
ncbi:hypothetical protein KDD30_08155 [Photobacterium sp. GJ3]|uniref:hypothetical protein n=1 Tax=Photobacterium sp. GJ3 TaxID=2829502 RepID=UPI001B8C9784|nr:hypothetical protein [Photobacterium sp. GJ3]QUJ66173.1 hypothetical protein KDD30_08155 [Photobacterium sp. GJ3]